MSEKTKKPSKLSRLLTRLFNNWFYKLVALGLACAFWYMIQGKEILEINKRMIAHIHVSDGFVVRGGATLQRDVTLRGPRVVLGYFKDPEIEAHVFIKKNKPGAYRFRLNKDHVEGWDSRVKLTVHDASVIVHVDKIAAKVVNVREFFKGAPAEGFIIEKVSIVPDKIKVTGPRSVLSDISEVLTEPIDISDVQQSKSFLAKLAIKDPEQLAISSEQVTVKLLVAEKKINRRFASIKIEAEGGQYETRIRPPYVSIVIQGTPGVLSFVKKNDLRAFVDVREFRPGSYEKAIKVKIPPETVLIETFPEYGTVDVYPKQLSKKKK